MDEQLAAWQAALAAAQKHIQLGQSLQLKGMTLLNSIPMAADGKKVDLAKEGVDPARLVQQATAAIERGSRIEREGHDKVLALYQQKPQTRRVF